MNLCSECRILIDGREIRVDAVQKKQLDDMVINSIHPKRVLDVSWTDEQILKMAENGLFIESCIPKGTYALYKTLWKYYVIVNERQQYLITVSDTGTETFGFPKFEECKIYEIIADNI